MLVDIFSVSTDKVRDISNHEQLTVTIRFVDNENQIREEFIAFIDVSEGTTGEISSKEMLWFIFLRLVWIPRKQAASTIMDLETCQER